MYDNAISLEEFWGVVRLLTDDAKRCLLELVEVPEDDREMRSFWRRMYARAVFAAIDGATYRMMFQAYAARARPDVIFSIDELMRLEKYYDFDEDQEAVATFSKIRMVEDIRFAFNVFARVHYSDYILPVHAPDWILIKEAARIKEGLQYPREAGELEVYEENLDTLMESLGWFVERMVEMLESCKRHTEERGASLESDEDEIIM